MNGFIEFLKRAFCEHKWVMVNVGSPDEDLDDWYRSSFVRCSKCGKVR